MILSLPATFDMDMFPFPHVSRELFLKNQHIYMSLLPEERKVSPIKPYSGCLQA